MALVLRGNGVVEGLTDLPADVISVADIPDGEITADKLHTTLDLSAKTLLGISTVDLSDYEEGTWTPTLSSGATGITNAVGEYRKIGDMVYLQMYVGLSGITGEVVLNNLSLPFVPKDVYTNSQVENTGVIFSENGHAMWSVYSGNSIHLFTDVTDIISNGNTTQATTGNWRGSIWYRTA